MLKFQQLAKDAQSNGDPVLAQNYLQHADHFTRVINERESIRREKFVENKIDENSNLSDETKKSNDQSN